MTNREVAYVLDRIADVLQIKDDNSFKVRAYRKAAHSIYSLDDDIRNIYLHNKLEEISGVGSGVKSKIVEMMETGRCEYYERLLKEIPAGVLSMLDIPGIGHKTIKVIYEELGIDNLDELLQAAQQKKIRALPGMGAKTEYNIKKGVEILNRRSGQATLGMALPIAKDLLAYLMDLDMVENAVIAGSIRRGKPLVSDIDILASTRDYERVREKVKHYRGVKQILSEEADHIKGMVAFNIEFEVILVEPENFYGKLIWTTGSKEHRNWLQSNFGFIPDEFAGINSEEEIYEKLGLKYIPPELRENQGEFEAIRKNYLPELVQIGDIKGDLHCHSDWSDGAHKITEMADTARQMGYSYLAITDHSKALPISGGLNEERLHAQGRVIEEINQQGSGIKVLKGIEVDILRNGRLDFEGATLQQLDLVVASVHSNFKLDIKAQTERILNAIRNPYVNIIGHLTGRLLNRRNGYEIDIDRILEEAARYNVALEINSHPDRLDIDAEIAHKARELGIKMAINSDSHDKNDLALLNYGVTNARRAWLEKDDVINTWDLDRLFKFLKRP